MSTERTRIRSLISRLGTLLEGLFIFILLLAGIAIVFLAKITGQFTPSWLYFTIGVSIEAIGIFLVGIYSYFRFLRQRSSDVE